MKVFILGGTGFLGYYSTLEFLKRGHEVSTISLPDVDLGNWFPKEVEVKYGNVFEMNEEEAIELLTGYDAIVYAIGPDDRYTPKKPAYDFFHERLVEACGKIIKSARLAGVKRCVVLNSYFAYFDRIWPEKKLAEHHPYIKCRVEQAERVIQEGGDSMDVMVLELPYIFGSMPERIPLWKDVFFERLFRMKYIFFTKGGSNMISAEHVGEAVAGAIENGKHGERYPIGDQNINWTEMITMIMDAMGIKKKIIIMPTFLAALYGKKMKNDDAKEGKESGLDHYLLFKDIQSQELFFDADISAKSLGYGRGGIKEAIDKTVKACYPNGFKEI